MPPTPRRGGDDEFCAGADATLIGEQGDDTLVAEDGRDTLYGGPGDDTLIVESAYSDTKISGGAKAHPARPERQIRAGT
ncbi:hypothetical protein [Hansschlegelia sp. KR7-227]|uniref:hypothetical protein n=1 Tax=Hansschlegelia sp. KR7-227 TaxID=3400914 RepID=UPI003C12140E